MDEIIGIIKWLPKEPTEYPASSGQFNIGIKINNNFYNKHDDIDKLVKILKGLKVGYEVKLKVDENKIDSIEVLSDKIETPEKSSFDDDIVKFETLLDDAHKKFEDKFEIKTEMLQLDIEKQFALFKAVVITHKNTNCEQIFEGHGDATSENVKGEFIKPHFIRMAETRSIVRALRWATNNATCSEEEK